MCSGLLIASPPTAGRLPISILPTVPCSALAGSLCLTFYHSPRRPTVRCDRYKSHPPVSRSHPAQSSSCYPLYFSSFFSFFSRPDNVAAIYSLLAPRRQMPSSRPVRPNCSRILCARVGPTSGGLLRRTCPHPSWPAATPPSPATELGLPDPAASTGVRTAPPAGCTPRPVPLWEERRARTKEKTKLRLVAIAPSPHLRYNFLAGHKSRKVRYIPRRNRYNNEG